MIFNVCLLKHICNSLLNYFSGVVLMRGHIMFPLRNKNNSGLSLLPLLPEALRFSSKLRSRGSSVS